MKFDPSKPGCRSGHDCIVCGRHLSLKEPQFWLAGFKGSQGINTGHCCVRCKPEVERLDTLIIAALRKLQPKCAR